MRLPVDAVDGPVSGVDELVAFVRRCLDEDERKIAAMEREETRVRTAPIFQGHPPNWLAGVDIFVSSKRWRAEVEAKRRILDLWSSSDAKAEFPNFDGGHATALEDVFTIMAQPYAGQDGWREEWARTMPSRATSRDPGHQLRMGTGTLSSHPRQASLSRLGMRRSAGSSARHGRHDVT